MKEESITNKKSNVIEQKLFKENDKEKMTKISHIKLIKIQKATKVKINSIKFWFFFISIKCVTILFYSGSFF